MNTFALKSEPISHFPAHPAKEIAPAPAEVSLRNILVPIDFSEASEKALSYAVPLARQFHAKITLLYVCQERFCGTEFAYLPIEESAVNWTAIDQLNSLVRGKIAPELVGGTVVRHGLAFEQIAQAARDLNSDLIIINTHGYTGLKHVLVGSTAERVIRHAPCPVLVVRERALIKTASELSADAGRWTQSAEGS
jgi:nucleotide-binding universal stress UspA family protein